MTFLFFCPKKWKERAERPWHKTFEGRWQHKFYSQDVCSDTLCLRSAEESSLFFPLIILYCQLKLVLAAYSMLIINPSGPTCKRQKKKSLGRTPCYVCAIGPGASMQNKITTFLHADIIVYNFPWGTHQQSFSVDCSIVLKCSY